MCVIPLQTDATQVRTAKMDSAEALVEAPSILGCPRIIVHMGQLFARTHRRSYPSVSCLQRNRAHGASVCNKERPAVHMGICLQGGGSQSCQSACCLRSPCREERCLWTHCHESHCCLRIVVRTAVWTRSLSLLAWLRAFPSWVRMVQTTCPRVRLGADLLTPRIVASQATEPAAAGGML